MLKRTISVILALCILLTVMPLLARAADEVAKNTFRERIDRSQVQTKFGGTIAYSCYYDDISVVARNAQAQSKINKYLDSERDLFFSEALQYMADFMSDENFLTIAQWADSKAEVFNYVSLDSVFREGNILSICLAETWSMIGPIRVDYHCYTFDLHDGELINLPSYLNKNSIITKQLVQQSVSQKITGSAYQDWLQKQETVSGSDYQYCLSGESGNLFLCFDGYEFGGGSQGGVKIQVMNPPMRTYSGKCGANAQWYLDENGTLTISGTGPMDGIDAFDVDFDELLPWYRQRNQINSVVVEEGITTIGAAFFDGCYNLQYADIPSSIERIEEYAFGDYYTKTLNVVYHGTEKQWNKIDISDFNNGNERIRKANVFFKFSSEDGAQSKWSEKDQWSFVNAATELSPNGDGYYISSRDYNHLVQNLSPYDASMVDYKAASTSHNTPSTLRYNVDRQRSRYKSWSGSCAGMSVSSMLFFNGELDLFEDLGQAKGSSVSNVQISDPVRSLINFYHNQQYLTVWQNTIRDFMNLSVGEQLSTIERLVLEGNPVLIFYEWIDYVNNSHVGSHAVVVYDVETGSFQKTVDGISITYQKKFRIYDPSNPDDSDQDYDIYYTVDGQKGIWCLPGHNIISYHSITGDQSVDEDITPDADANKVNLPRYNNGAFELATTDNALLNAVNYRDGSVSSAVLNAKLNSARLYALSDDQYSVTTSGGAIAVDGIRYTKAGENGITAYIAAAPNYLADGNTTVSDVTVFLPENSSYTVKSDEALSFGFADKGIATFADADSAGVITFHQTGGASIAANKSCDISVTMLADSHDKKWDSVTVTAENGKKLDVVPTDSGALLTGDSLKGAVVEITDGNKTTSATIESDMKAADVVYQGGKISVEQMAMVFSDVPSGAYYYQPVYWAVNHVPQITNGTSATTFSPDANCTRAQMVTFLWRAAGEPAPKSATNPFGDVKSSAYYYKAVLWAVEKGITNGSSATTFSPDATVTRAQTVTFLWRMEGQPKGNTTNPFKDVKAGQYYTNAVLWAVKNEITNGTSASTFAPDASCTRAQIVTFLYRDLG